MHGAVASIRTSLLAGDLTRGPVAKALNRLQAGSYKSDQTERGFGCLQNRP